MMIEPHPPRLVTTPEFSALLSRVAARGFSEARLEHSRRAVAAALGGVAGAAGAGTGATGVGVKAASIAKVGITVALGLSASVAVWHTSRPAGRHTAPFVAAPPPAVALAPAAAPPAAEIEETPVAPAVRRRFATRSRLERRDDVLRPSAVAEQLELFRTAERHAGDGRYDAALALLDELERRFPDGPLATEAALTRAEVLFVAGRDAAAAAFIEARLEHPGLASHKAQLWLMLGDLRLRGGSCPGAGAAYQRALGLGLRDEEAEAARRGLRRCTP